MSSRGKDAALRIAPHDGTATTGLASSSTFAASTSLEEVAPSRRYSPSANAPSRRAGAFIDAWAGASLVTGAAIVHLLRVLPISWTSAVFIACGASLALTRRRVVRLVGWLALGFGLASMAGAHALAQRWPVTHDGVDARATIVVRGLPERFEQGWRFDALVTVANENAPGAPSTLRARLSWFDRDAEVAPGMTLDATVRLRSPRGTRNPGAFDFERYAVERGIDATGYLRGPPSVIATTAPRLVDTARHAIATRIAESIGTSRAAALVRALAIGDQSAIDDPEWRLVRATGIAHLIAISGFHVAMVAACGALLPLLLLRLAPGLCLIWPRRHWLRAGVLATACVYAAIAGGAVPVLRTVAMIALVCAFGWLRRRIATSAMLAVAAVAIVSVDPLATLNAGFWLSFAGVAWLIYGLAGRSSEPVWRTYLRAQALVSLALVPLSLALFQQVSLVGPIVNVLAVPWFSLVLVPIALIGATFATMAMPGADFVLGCAAALAEWTWVAIGWIAAWPHTNASWPAPTVAVLVAASVGIAMLLLPRAVPGRALGFLLLIPMLAPRLDAPPHGAFTLDVIDVGQGLAVLARTNNHAVLFDTGPGSPGRLDLGESAVVPLLVARGVSRLDRLIVSHADSDHAGGLAAVRRVFDAPLLAGPDVKTGKPCEQGQTWQWDGVTFTIVHPPPHFPALGNDSSCVLRIDSAHGSALIPGDISTQIEQRLVDANAPLRADLLIVPHHGSRGSSSPAFIAAVAPRIAIVSAGWHNRFGHPPAEVLARYRDAGVRVINTADDGELQLALRSGGRIALTAERAEHPRWWQSR